MPDLHARKLTTLVPACDTGRHVLHPLETCDEYEEYSAHVRAYFARAFDDAFTAADQFSIVGNGMGEMLGVFGREQQEPTPAEQAFAVLAPHLADVPLYRPKWKARP